MGQKGECRLFVRPLAESQYIIYDRLNGISVFQSGDSPIVLINRKEKYIEVFEGFGRLGENIGCRGMFMRQSGFADMGTPEGFEYYLRLGAIGGYEILDMRGTE